MVARAYGLKVIATGTTPETKDIITRCGAHTVLQYSSKDYTENILVRSLTCPIRTYRAHKLYYQRKMLHAVDILFLLTITGK